jgi:preprotein translocase subunit SecF
MELIRPDTNFDFMRLRRISIAISIALLVVALVGFFARGLNLALDFTGGASVELHFTKPVDQEAIKTKLSAAGINDAVVQTLGEETKLMIRLRAEEAVGGKAGKAAERVLAAVQSTDNPVRVESSETVGPQVGGEIVENGIIAILFVALGFLIYISIRFEWKFAVAAILTTLHDVLVVTGIFSLFQIHFDIVVFAGILSIMGYSINDTIVVFDRVRENFRSMHKAEPIEVLNRSVNETLSRTIITSFVALLTVVALYLFGGQSLEGMALSQILGIIIGTLSSIFFACPLLLWLGVTKYDLMKGQDDDPRLAEMP